VTKPPPLPPRLDPEVVHVEEPAPSTQRHPILPPAPREPFPLLTRKQPNNAEIQDKVHDGLMATSEVLGVVRKMARQVDGLGQTFNVRMGVLHQELALMRGITDVEPEKPYEPPPPSKARLAAVVGGKYTGAALLGAFVLRAIAKHVPEFAEAIEVVLGALGL